MNQDKLTKIVSLCKRRGFVFGGSEIYGGLSSVWDYGPLGAKLKKKIRDIWWDSYVEKREDIIGLDSSIIMHEDVFRASGHLEGFVDKLMLAIDNVNFDVDYLEDDIIYDLRDGHSYIKRLVKGPKGNPRQRVKEYVREWSEGGKSIDIMEDISKIDSLPKNIQEVVDNWAEGVINSTEAVEEIFNII